MSDNPLAEWQIGILKTVEFAADPEGYRRKLTDLAMLAHHHGQVGADELSEMLELTDAGREWAKSF